MKKEGIQMADKHMRYVQHHQSLGNENQTTSQPLEWLQCFQKKRKTRTDDCQ